jgi:hypothetical protein
MERNALIDSLKQKVDLNIYVSEAEKDKGLIGMLLDVIEQEKNAVKFRAENIVRKISEERPELLYPYFDRMGRLLDSDSSFIRWGFILTLPNLIRVDKENKWESIHERYLAILDTDSVPAFGNVVSSVWKILASHPEAEKEIVPKLLKIDGHAFIYKGEVSPDCLSIAKGHIIDCFDRIYENSSYQEEMLAFAQVNADNPRNLVRRKARRFITNHSAVGQTEEILS